MPQSLSALVEGGDLGTLESGTAVDSESKAYMEGSQAASTLTPSMGRPPPVLLPIAAAA